MTTAIEDSADISSFCIGRPRTLVSSHSGAITLALSLQEPILYLSSASPQGSSSYREHDNSYQRTGDDPSPSIENGHGRHHSQHFLRHPLEPTNSGAGSSTRGEEQSSDLPPSILRGSILLKLTKPTKLKSLSLTFSGKCRTSWSQSARQNLFDESLTSHPMAEIQDEVNINEHHWEFLPAENVSSCTGSEHSITTIRTNLYGADVAKFKSEPDKVYFKDDGKSECTHNGPFRTISHSSSVVPLFTPNHNNPKRKHSHQVHSHKDSTMFPAGEYVYNFILAVDPSVPETINVAHGAVHYHLTPKLIRTGPFSLNISEPHEVEIVRSPPNLCDSITNNPIVISRNWDDRLHYEILIPQKFIPLGSSVPMAIKLTPLEKIMVHRVRVHVVETVEYRYSTDTSISFTDRSLKILLFEKKAQTEKIEPDKGSSSSSGHGGGLHLLKPLRHEQPKKRQREKLTGNLLHYLNASNIERSGASTSESIEDAAATTIDCTLPFLSEPAKWDDSAAANYFSNSTYYPDKISKQLHPDSQNCPYIKIRHRFTISFRISKQDPGDTKRRHFEVKIDTPVHFLSKYCNTENVELPQYNYEHLSGSAPLSQVNSNDSWYPTSTTYAIHHNPFGQDPLLPSFDDALAQSFDSDTNNLSQSSDNSLPPDYYSIIHEDRPST
ncbi:hypothetical protein TRICI_002604 [Trichomonascus ciferrii]|uniref:Arrestin C-terminal-like domain-containing protein n=1 Tax=Trichomonascus ciferrii TaxID=44093 RepID=A0A642V6A7_9ASCO|nr:hypothetical protein TRICI_002604 [Trichomonascus ciferrii]